MRTNEERECFCKVICAAARKMGIALGRSSCAEGTRYVWRDPMTEKIIKGAGSLDKKIALESACDALVLSMAIT